MQRKALILPLTLGFLIPCRSVLASPVRAVYSSQARGVNSPLIGVFSTTPRKGIFQIS